jgi:transcriptional regulator with XRE-family HTH domain
LRGKPHPIVTELRNERIRQGLTLDRLGEMSGYARTHIGVIETGHQGCRIEIACDLAQALGMALKLERKTS